MLLIIPVIVLVFSILFKLAIGPYWLATNFDPSYLYLVNGMHILKGVPINDMTHPGTPLQSLCGAIGWVFNIGQPASAIAINVFKSPEFYLGAVFVILTLVSFLTSFFLAAYVFRQTNDKLAAVLTQLPVISFFVLKSREAAEPVLPVIVNISPEAMLISVLNLFSLALFMNYFSKSPRENLNSSLIWGFICGLGTAVKFTFLPLIAIPLIVLSWRNKFLFTGVFTASFVLWTIPAFSKYALQWSLVKSFLFHGGSYLADGHEGFDISGFCSNWINFILAYKLFFAFLLAAIILIFRNLVRRQCDRPSFFLSAIIIGIIFQFSVVTKNPGAHYLLPGLGLLSVLLFFLYSQGVSHYVHGKRLTFAFILIFVFWGIGQANVYRLQISSFTKDIVSFHDQMNLKYQRCAIIDYYRSSSPAMALFFGDGWNGEFQFRDELFQDYPQSFVYSKGGSDRISSFKDIVWANDLLAQNACVIFRGDGDIDFSQSPYVVHQLDKGRFETIHLLTATTEKQAVMFFSGMLHFLQGGEYPKALACAFQAKTLHYQPEGSLENIIQLLKARVSQ